MAEVICRDLLQSKKILGYTVASAGVGAWEGAGASPNAIRAVKDMGLDLTAFRSRELTGELVRAAELILVMEPIHRKIILEQWPEAAEKVRFLVSYDTIPSREVPDPIGASLEAYKHGAEQIRRCVEGLLDELEG